MKRWIPRSSQLNAFLFLCRDPNCDEVVAEYCTALAGKGQDRAKIEKSIEKILDKGTTNEVCNW